MGDDLQAAKVSMRLAARAVCASVRSMRQASAAVCSCFALCWSCKPGQLTPHQPLQPLILLNPREARWLPFRIMLPKIEGLPLRSDKVYNYPFFFSFFFFFSYGYCLKETGCCDCGSAHLLCVSACVLFLVLHVWGFLLIFLFRWGAKIFPNHRKRIKSPR